jgi:hypothetical protein
MNMSDQIYKGREIGVALVCTIGKRERLVRCTKASAGRRLPNWRFMRSASLLEETPTGTWK